MKKLGIHKEESGEMHSSELENGNCFPKSEFPNFH